MAPKKAKVTAPSTKSIASPKSRRAPKRRASPMEELSPRIKRRATRAPTQDRDLDQESREADAKIPDFTSAMDNDHEGVVLQSRQSPRHEADSTKGHAQSTSGDQNQSSDQKHPGDQEELSDQKLVNPEQPIDQKPVKPEQSMDQEPVNQKQSMDQKPVNPEQPMDQKPVNPGQSMDQEPVNPEQPIDQKQPDDSPSPVHDKESTGNKPPDHRAPFYLDRIRNTPPFNEDEVYRFNRFADEIIVLDEYNHKKLKVDLDHRVAELVGGSTLIPWNQLNVDAQHKLEALGNNVESYVKSANCIHHGLVHTAFTWRVLFDNLLSPDCSEKWCGEFWTTYGTMLGQFRERVTDADNSYVNLFQTWRHGSVRMAHAIHGLHSDRDRLTEILMEQLGQFMKMSVQAVDQLANAAILLDFGMQLSPYYFKVDMQDLRTLQRSGFPYREDSQEMALAEGTRVAASSTSVDFIVSPLLRSYGERYSRELLSPYYHCFDLCTMTTPMVVCAGQFPNKQGCDGDDEE